ncbi:MAG: AbrB/MazE/SpoVT family DNA-binding domain-containing protein [Candidatus Bilamarchaeum sp.]|jgi:hypothetical protein
MVNVFKSILRKVGTSKGILIPQEQLKSAEIELGDEIEIAILTHKKDLSGFGMTKGFKIPFSRDKKDREFE